MVVEFTCCDGMKKRCPKCGIEKEVTEFHKDSSRKDGLYGLCKECKKKYQIENKESLKKYRDNNKERFKDYYQNYRYTHKPQMKEFNKKYHKYRFKNDNCYKLKHTIRSLIYMSLRNKGFKKNTKTNAILGCSTDFFKSYIESKFEPWMNWENHGKFNGELNCGWDLDHIIPVSSATSEEDIIKLSHYTNFQPLCSFVNRYVKRDKYA